MLTLTLTKKTVITWVGPWTTDDETTYLEGQDLRFAKINDMISQNKTDGVGTQGSSDNIHERHWVDEDAAKEYVVFIVDLVNHGKLPPLVSTAIADYHAIIEATPATVV